MPNSLRSLHHLEGLQAQPLASYLTALAVLRLVHEQKDATVSGAWCDGHFILDTVLNEDELLSFFLDDYQPTPLASPWNGGSGFYAKDNKDGFNAILHSDVPRFAPYRKTLEKISAMVASLDLDARPEGEDKVQLFRGLRATLDDRSLQWLDAAVVLIDDNGQTLPKYAPLLGTGGNDGHLDFSSNQMQRLEEMFISDKAKPQENLQLLKAALFGSITRFLKNSPIGQFDPGSAGGPNLSVGFEGNALLNPWYYVLMIEGALVMAAAAVGRLKDPSRSGSAFPFTVSHFGAGNGKLGNAEKNRQELWLPLWDKPAGYPEVQGLFAEGRAQVGAQQARNPVEFSLALASHGTSRGLTGFSRYGFLERNGKSYFATPLGYHAVGSRDNASLIRSLERWFSRWRSKLSNPASVARAVRRYDTAVMDHLATGRKGSFVALLERLGELHLLLCHTPKLRAEIRPLPTLEAGWAKAADQDEPSPELRLALALSSLSGDQEARLDLRAQLSPYDSKKRTWEEVGWIPRWVGSDVCQRMLGVLRHRLLAAKKSADIHPNKEAMTLLWGQTPATRSDIDAFIEGRINDQRLERLVYALCLLAPAKHDLRQSYEPDFLPLAYLLPKLALHQGWLHYTGAGADSDKRERDRRPPPSSLANLLAGGKVEAALRTSRRFLLGRGLTIPAAFTTSLALSPENCRRLAAAMLFPISDSTYKRIALNILKLESED